MNSQLLQTVKSFAIVVALACGATSNAMAQTGVQLFRGILDAARQSQQQTAPSQGQTGIAQFPIPGQTFQKPTIPVPTEVMWRNKQALLDAARAGQMIGFDGRGMDESSRVASSVYFVLMYGYGVPPIPQECSSVFRGQVAELLGAINEGNAALMSTAPPRFEGDPSERTRAINRARLYVRGLQDIGGGHTLCETMSMGRPTPHPYQAALATLALDFDQVTQEYVMGERARRQTAYQQQVAVQQQEQTNRQAAGRAAEQQRIDAEAARIRADEQRRAAKEKARVGG